MGIAIDNGVIKSKEEPIFDFLPDYQDLKTDKKEKILLKHLVTMSAGFQWKESDVPYGTEENDETMMYRDENGCAIHYRNR